MPDQLRAKKKTGRPISKVKPGFKIKHKIMNSQDLKLTPRQV